MCFINFTFGKNCHSNPSKNDNKKSYHVSNDCSLSLLNKTIYYFAHNLHTCIHAEKNFETLSIMYFTNSK